MLRSKRCLAMYSIKLSFVCEASNGLLELLFINLSYKVVTDAFRYIE